jgi:hypothetical protein
MRLPELLAALRSRTVALARLLAALPIAVLVIAVPLLFPAILLYALVAPLFGPTPAADYSRIATQAMWFVAGLAAVFGTIFAAGWLASRFRAARILLQFLGILIVAAIIAGGVLQWFSGAPPCSGGRYSFC